MVLAFNHTFTFVRNLRVYDPSHYWFNSIEYAWYAFVIEKLVLQRWKQKTAMAAADDPSVYQVKWNFFPGVQGVRGKDPHELGGFQVADAAGQVAAGAGAAAAAADGAAGGGLLIML